MSADELAPIEVILYCDYCLNPITFYHRPTDSVFTQSYIFVEHTYICAKCAPIAGYSLDNKFALRENTWPVSKS
jgi:hypothetical protein